MEGIALVKISELTGLLDEIKSIKQEMKTFCEREENLKAYSIQQAADLLNLHYSSVRKLILQKKLYAKYLDGDHGKCSIPAWAITNYLKKESE